MNKKLKTKRVFLYEVKKILNIAEILHSCGQDMAKRYGLHHWDNSMIKTYIILVFCLLKNQVYLVLDDNNLVATFQIKKMDDVLFFEKLAVIPMESGKGYGSYCMELIETKARELDCKKVRMEVYDQSQHAIEFYVAKGYMQVGEANTLKYTDIVMEKIVEN